VSRHINGLTLPVRVIVICIPCQVAEFLEFAACNLAVFVAR
jgi:hypothetical protein